MQSERNSVATESADRELVVSRVFAAPRSRVFQAYLDPNSIPKWWGPRRLTTTVEKLEARPGGAWRFVQRDPKGTEYIFHGVFREIVPDERLVHTFRFEGAPGKDAVVSVKFESLPDGTTKLTSVTRFENVKDFQGFSNAGARRGAEEAMDRLAEFLAAAPSNAGDRAAEGDFVLTRFLDAPPETVFDAWTNPKRMAHWWGPHRFTNPVCELDARTGGSWRIVMRGPDGSDHPAHGIYLEVARPHRLVMTIDHSELPDEWHDMVNPGRDRSREKPSLTATNSVTFEPEGAGTRLTIRVRFESTAIRDALLKIGMNEGWGQSLERLAEVVKKAR